MNSWEKRFMEIMDADESNIIKTIKLNDLMDHMERIAGIPGMRDPEFDQRNPELMKLYRRISAARVF